MIRRRKPETKKGAPAWMTTFSDLMTLILVLFILLYSFSEIDAIKFRAVSDSFKALTFDNNSMVPLEYPQASPVESFNPPTDFDNKNRATEKGDRTNDGTLRTPSQADIDKQNQELDNLLYKINDYLADNNLEDVIMVTREERGIVLVLQENVLFDSGKATLKRDSEPFLNEMADLIKDLPNIVEVEGHTDSQKIIQPSRYTSNWNLSGDRAANVVNYFIKEYNMPSQRFRIAGYADTMPIATNETAEGRAKNRRVVIVILHDKINSTK